jgi:hypothetical protein
MPGQVDDHGVPSRAQPCDETRERGITREGRQYAPPRGTGAL